MDIELNKAGITIGSEALSKLLRFDVTPEERNDLSFRINYTKNYNDLLKSLGDTTFGMRMDEYLNIVTSLGFRCEEVISFFDKDRHFKGKPIEERQFFYWNADKSALLVTDTLTTIHPGGGVIESVNSAKMYFEAELTDMANTDFLKENNNILTIAVCNDENKQWSPDLAKDEYYIQFNLDASRAIRHTFASLEGKIIYRKKWNIRKHPKRLWMCHYGDAHRENFNKPIRHNFGQIFLADIICAERVNMLSSKVKDAIGAEQWIKKVS